MITGKLTIGDTEYPTRSSGLTLKRLWEKFPETMTMSEETVKAKTPLELQEMELFKIQLMTGDVFHSIDEIAEQLDPDWFATDFIIKVNKLFYGEGKETKNVVISTSDTPAQDTSECPLVNS